MYLSLKSGLGAQRWSSANFQVYFWSPMHRHFQVYFWSPMHRQSISNTTWGLSHVKVTKGHPVQIFKKVSKIYLWVPLHRKTILYITGGPNQVKVTKGHQVQIFKKSIFDLLCTENAFWTSWEVKIMSNKMAHPAFHIDCKNLSVSLWSSVQDTK